MDLDETLVAHEFATSSRRGLVSGHLHKTAVHLSAVLTCTIVVRIEHGKEGANGEDVRVLRKCRHLDGRRLRCCQSITKLGMRVRQGEEEIGRC